MNTMMLIKSILLSVFLLTILTVNLYAQPQNPKPQTLDFKSQAIISISIRAAQGELEHLKEEIHSGLDQGLTVNQIKESLVHLYAYCGFPRSIRGLQTLMEVLEYRKNKGVDDVLGKDATVITDERSKYERGKEILGKLTGASLDEPRKGYAAFAPEIEIFLKEHLFADLFERDVLSYIERELVTISVLSAIGGVEPMLQSHMTICLNIGVQPEQLKQFVNLITLKAGKKEGKIVKTVLVKVLENRQ
jgi:4-carboxymuconolactone decarboxylase